MNYSIIKKNLNKVFEDMGGIASSSFALPGIEGGMKKKKKDDLKKNLIISVQKKVGRT